MDKIIQLYEVNKQKVENLNSMAEYVKSKIQSLSQQRIIVEKANEEAGKLNVLFWDMEAKINKLTEENKLIKKNIIL